MSRCPPSPARGPALSFSDAFSTRSVLDAYNVVLEAAGRNSGARSRNTVVEMSAAISTSSLTRNGCELRPGLRSSAIALDKTRFPILWAKIWMFVAPVRARTSFRNPERVSMLSWL